MGLRRASLWGALLLLVLSIAPAQAQNDPPRQGLMWNRTGLPAVFPLQVKTLRGQDYVLLLSNTETGADVLAAYIIGGEFFRVLVPPGTFRVRFASGITWQGDAAMFGRHGQTKVFEMPEPLTFEVIGMRRKAGHLIDLTTLAPGEVTQAPTQPLQICQYAVLDESAFAGWLEDRQKGAFTQHRRLLTLRSRICFPS